MQIQKKSAAQFKKEDNATPSEKKLAAEFGMTVEEFRYHQQNYVDTAKQEKEHRQMPPDPKIRDENEEMFVTGSGMMRGGRKRDGQLTETIQAVQYTGPEAVSRERVEEERRALEEMKSQHMQVYHYEQHHDDYQVIERGRKSVFMEDTYILIYEYNPILSYIYPEQDSERRGYELQPPNLSAMAQDHMRVSYQSKVSPQSQHYMKEGAEGVSILMIIHFLITLLILLIVLLYASPPPTDPHHQFTIGSMVHLDVQKGEPLYGVLQWAGTVPDFTGTIAGVELVSDYKKCAYLFNTINRSGH